MVTKVFKRDRTIKIVIKDSGYAQVFNNGAIVAHLTCEEEARRVIWIGFIIMAKAYRPITDEMFEVVQNEI